MSQITKSTAFLLILLLGLLLSGCQSETADENTATPTAVSNLTIEPTVTNTPTATNPPPQPSDTARPPTSTPQPTSTPLPTATPTAASINWAAIHNGATVLYYKDQDLWRSNIEGGEQQALTEGDLLAFWNLESVEGKWWQGTLMPRPFVSPDGRFIAFTQTGRNMVIVDVANPASPRTLSSGSTLMAWSYDSRYLAYGRNTLYLYDTVTNFSRDISSTVSRGVHNITWSPDGRYIAFSCCFSPPEGEYKGVEYGEIRQFDMETGLIETTIGEPYNSIGGGTPSLCWQEAGYFLPHQEAEQTDHCTPTGSISIPSDPSPDNERYAWMLFSSEEDPLHNRQLTVSNYETDETVWQIVLEEAANKVAWSADGRYILLNHYYPGLSPIWRLPADGTSPPEPIIEEAYLMDVVPMWQESQ